MPQTKVDDEPKVTEKEAMHKGPMLIVALNINLEDQTNYKWLLIQYLKADGPVKLD